MPSAELIIELAIYSDILPQPELSRMSTDAIDAAITLCDARSRQATQAGAKGFARLLNWAETRDSC